MSDNEEKETTGAWIVSHGRKIAMDANGSAEFPAIDEAAKAANLLSRLGESHNNTLSRLEVEAVARAARINPRHELTGLLQLLEEKRLIEQKGNQIDVLGITTRGALAHATDIYKSSSPSVDENAVIDLAEKTSHAPISVGDIAEYLGDTHKLTSTATTALIRRAEELGFVDSEGSNDSKLIFNGNLFKRGTVEKTQKVLTSLSSSEQNKVIEFDGMLKSKGCLDASRAMLILETDLFEKLKATGMYDLNAVSNDAGEHVFITSPAAFHKFVSPLIDDAFDHAKALVSALTYGMTSRPSTQGRIVDIGALLRKLVNGDAVGPATAIGHDYNVLEMNRVVKIIPSGNLFHMRLLKREVGELALQVLTVGDASTSALKSLPEAPMNGYMGPEASRDQFRRIQRPANKKATQNILSALRGGKAI